jgi:hypothetical protein
MQMEHEEWWQPGNASYDVTRVARLLTALHRLIDRDASLTDRPVQLGSRYPGNVALDIAAIGAREDDGSDDWFFTLTGPGFRVVLLQFTDPNSLAVVSEALDEVEGEAPALAWLADPPGRLELTPSDTPARRKGMSIPRQLYDAVTQLVPDIAQMTLNDTVLLDRPLLDRTGIPFSIDVDPGCVNAEPVGPTLRDTENTRSVALWQWSQRRGRPHSIEDPDCMYAIQRERGYVIRLDIRRRRANVMTFAHAGEEISVPPATRASKNLLALEWILDLLARGPHRLSHGAVASDDPS